MAVHFGMSGAFRTSALPGPPPTATTRLRLVDAAAGIVAHLSAMTVLSGGPELYAARTSALGPDPLREDADPEVLWASVRASKKPIGARGRAPRGCPPLLPALCSLACSH
jgi:endonuclease-8